MNRIIAGREEKPKGLRDIKVVCIENHLSMLDGWTAEAMIAEWMMNNYPSETRNKSAKFGLGPKLHGYANAHCTLTLVRGVKNYEGYHAYEKYLDCSDNDLHKLMEDGKEAEKDMKKFAKMYVSAYNPDRDFVFQNNMPHPSSSNPVDVLSDSKSKEPYMKGML